MFVEQGNQKRMSKHSLFQNRSLLPLQIILNDSIAAKPPAELAVIDSFDGTENVDSRVFQLKVFSKTKVFPLGVN